MIVQFNVYKLYPLQTQSALKTATVTNKEIEMITALRQPTLLGIKKQFSQFLQRQSAVPFIPYQPR